MSVKEGTLLKKDRSKHGVNVAAWVGISKLWQERKFNLSASNLKYSTLEGVAKGEMKIDSTTTVDIVTEKEYANAFRIRTTSSDEELYLCAATEEERSGWMAAIRGVASANFPAPVTASVTGSSTAASGDVELTAAGAVEVEKDYKMPVVGCHTVCTLKEINDVEQNFVVDLEIYFHWLADDEAIAFVEENYGTGHDSIFQLIKHEDYGGAYFMPKIAYSNATSFEMLVEDKVYYDPQQKQFYAGYNYLVTYTELLELQRFPFDRQLFKYSFTMNCHSTAFDTVNCTEFQKLKKHDGFKMNFQLDQWSIEKYTTTAWAQGDKSMYTSRIYATRDPTYYLTNVVLVLFIVSLMAVTVSAMDTSDFASRSSLLVTLVLTAVAFKFVTAEYIPKVSYSTYLDHYSLMAFAFLSMVVVESYIIYFLDSSLAQRIDDVFAVIYTIVWVLIHVGILAGAVYGWFYESWESMEKNQVGSDSIFTGPVVVKSHPMPKKKPVTVAAAPVLTMQPVPPPVAKK